jgi:hypothetical protein
MVHNNNNNNNNNNNSNNNKRTRIVKINLKRNHQNQMNHQIDQKRIP